MYIANYSKKINLNLPLNNTLDFTQTIQLSMRYNQIVLRIYQIVKNNKQTFRKNMLVVENILQSIRKILPVVANNPLVVAKYSSVFANKQPFVGKIPHNVIAIGHIMPGNKPFVEKTVEWLGK
jgi:translation elongation factor EF-1alpha